MERLTKILLIEDEQTFARAVEQTLRRNATFLFEFKQASTMLDGLELLSTNAFDVVLLDLSLPDSRNLISLRQIRKHCPMLPVVILTGNEDEALAISALQEGAQDYLLKGQLDGKILARSILYSMERAHLMQQRDEFMATLVHDLKNPLVGSDRVFEMILQRRFGDLDPRLHEVTSMLKRSNESALQLLANLLEIYKYDVSKPLFQTSCVDLRNVLSSSAEELGPLAEIKSLVMKVALSDNINVNADAKALRRVFTNLIGNSIKFTPEGGWIEIEAFATDAEASVIIRDSGSGISAAEQRFLFQRFYQSSSGRYNTALGTGLGLYVCRQIVEAHEGNIKCESVPEQGTTFVINLPRVCEEEFMWR